MKIAKPHLEYSALLNLLKARGMSISNEKRAIHKLQQIGYYRLSGFWYPFKKTIVNEHGQLSKIDEFQTGTSFELAYELYYFDKKLRLLMLDAIERIEVYVRTIMAHELGKLEPLAHISIDPINPKHINGGDQIAQQQYLKWRIKSLNCVHTSKEDFIKSHQKLKKEIPIWVAVETWDFGCISKYYAMLKQGYQNKIAKKLDISNAKALEKWLEYLNITRNRCAHHSRIWNVPIIGGDMVFLENSYFTSLGLTSGSPSRIFSVIAIIWYLLKNLAPKSKWLDEIATLIDVRFPKSPSLTYQSMGINPGHEKFIDLFTSD